MSNHTPKPWPITWERDTNHNGPRRAVSIGPIAVVGDHWSGLTIADEADARLASASPELLAACVAGGRYSDALIKHQDAGTIGAIESTDELERLFSDWHDKTHAGIAKALACWLQTNPRTGPRRHRQGQGGDAMSKLEWTNIYESEDGNDPCWELPGVIEPTAGSSSGCSNCYPILDVSAEHRAIIVAAIAEATSNDSWAVFHE